MTWSVVEVSESGYCSPHLHISRSPTTTTTSGFGSGCLADHQLHAAASERTSSRENLSTPTNIGSYSRTHQVLQDTFPKHRIHIERQPYTRPTQTSLFGNLDRKPGEVDLVLTP